MTGAHSERITRWGSTASSPDRRREGIGTRKTARLTGVHKDTVTRYTRRAGDHAEQLHDELVPFSPEDR
jgi:hypothetical protein